MCGEPLLAAFGDNIKVSILITVVIIVVIITVIIIIVVIIIFVIIIIVVVVKYCDHLYRRFHLCDHYH